jgi:hypothetical protein
LNVTQRFSPAFKTTPTLVVAPGQPAAERFDCIVYTSDITTLRNNMICFFGYTMYDIGYNFINCVPELCM